MAVPDRNWILVFHLSDATNYQPFNYGYCAVNIQGAEFIKLSISSNGTEKASWAIIKSVSELPFEAAICGNWSLQRWVKISSTVASNSLLYHCCMTVSRYLFSTSLPQGLYCAQRLAAATTEGWCLFYSCGCAYNSRVANYMTVIKKEIRYLSWSKMSQLRSQSFPYKFTVSMSSYTRKSASILGNYIYI